MAIIERIITVCLIIIIVSALILVALYQIYKFSIDGGFQNSFSGRILIAGVCFNSILIAIIFYLITEVALLRRLIDKIKNDLIEEEPQLTLKEKIFQTIRGRSTDKKKKKED